MIDAFNYVFISQRFLPINDRVKERTKINDLAVIEKGFHISLSLLYLRCG